MTKPEFGKYYVVDVSFSENNPIHRAIMSSYRVTTATLTGSYEPASLENFNLSKLSYLKVICEIPQMNEKPKHFMPSEAKEAEKRYHVVSDNLCIIKCKDKGHAVSEAKVWPQSVKVIDTETKETVYEKEV